MCKRSLFSYPARASQRRWRERYTTPRIPHRTGTTFADGRLCVRFILSQLIGSLLCALSQIAIMPAEQRAALRKGTAPYAKPHACPRCAAAFTRAGNLKTHVRTVHEKRRDHVCPHCAATFGAAGSLKIHVRRKHPCEVDCPPPPATTAEVLAADHIVAALLVD